MPSVTHMYSHRLMSIVHSVKVKTAITSMTAYIIRRLLLMIPTLLAIMIVNFFIIQVAPGGPVEQVLANLAGIGDAMTERITRSDGGEIVLKKNTSNDHNSKYRGAQGLDPTFLRELEKQFGFDRPLHARFFLMMKQYAVFDFGESYYRDRNVVDLVLDKMPVSISLGLWTTLLVYLISIPLGIAKAARDGSRFDVWTSIIVFVAYAIPGFLFAIFLLILFASGNPFDWFPLARLSSENWDQLGWAARIVDYFWHLTLPIVAMTIGGFAGLTMLTKNSFLDQINQQYVLTARAKGLTERRILYGHVFRNAMLIVIAGFPGAFIGILFTGSLFIEIIFSLDGLGLLGFEAALNRDYPVMFASLYFFSLLGLLMNLVGDLMYMIIDPRIDFETREV